MAHLARAPQLRRPGPVVDAPRQPVPDHGARRPAADPELRHNMLGMTEAGSTLLLSGDESDQPESPTRLVRQARPPGSRRDRRYRRPSCRGGRAVNLHPRAPRDAALLPPQPRRVLRRRRLVPHRRSGAHRRRRVLLLPRPTRRDDQDRRRQRLTREVGRAIAAVTGGTVAHVVGLPDADRGQVVAAAIVGRRAAFDEAPLRTRAGGRTVVLQDPTTDRCVAAADVPLLSSGKVDRPRLRRLFDD